MTTPADSAAATTASAATLLIELAERLDVHRLEGEATIGRDRKCTIVLDHPTVSRTHARIYRDAAGWHLQDLGSQNGSKLAVARKDDTNILDEGAQLRIGRVRAWFFAGAVPTGWAPSDAPRLAGKLIRCSCGHIGWAPVKTGDSLLRCTACGRDIMRRDPNVETPPPMTKFRTAQPIAPAAADCAACHSQIAAGERMHTCKECGATMHADCWSENRGCATYGCSQVGILDQVSEPSAAAEQAEPEATSADEGKASNPLRALTGVAFDVALTDAFKQSLMAVAAFAVAGLPLFGVPPIGYAAYRLVAADTSLEGNRRFAWAAISFAAGVVGFACSATWWLGVHW